MTEEGPWELEPRVSLKDGRDLYDAVQSLLDEAGYYENAELAQQLADLELGEDIPEKLFLAIAHIIAFAYHLQGKTPKDWRKSVYYEYFEYPHGWHSVKQHYGVRTDRYKLIHFYNDINAWELYDLKLDPSEMNNLIEDAEHQKVIKELKVELERLRKELKVT